MLWTLILLLNKWNATKTERQKLQHALLLLSALIILLAGIVSLFKARLGHDVVLIALFTLAVFIANAIVWNLMQSSVIWRLDSQKKRRK